MIIDLKNIISIQVKIYHIQSGITGQTNYNYKGIFTYESFPTSGKYIKFFNEIENKYVGIQIFSSTSTSATSISISEFFICYKQNCLVELDSTRIDK